MLKHKPLKYPWPELVEKGWISIPHGDGENKANVIRAAARARGFSVKITTCHQHYVVELVQELPPVAREGKGGALAEQLRVAFRGAGLSIRALAKRAGVDPMSVSCLMRGEGVSLETAEKLAKSLGLKALEVPS